MPSKKLKPKAKQVKPASKKPAKTAQRKPTPKLVTKNIAKPAPKPIAKPVMAKEYFYASGKRKTSIARVKLFSGKGDSLIVNDKPLDKYFTLQYSQVNIRSPFSVTSTAGKFDAIIHVAGGGINSQADAIRHGIARALLQYDATLRSTLKRAGFLTRDARIKERKKPGLHRARRGPQFSKR